ncbi:MAG: hypothetical protein AAFO06_06960 [Cyanobacteria bacterium J06597_16]
MTLLSSASPRTQRLKKTLLALAVCGLAFPSVSNAQVVDSSADVTTARASTSRPALDEGTYLFGQSPEANQVGSAYAVFSVQNNNQIIGAFYHPHSSFDCFSGEVLSDQLAVNVIDSYDQTGHPYSVALRVEEALVAGAGAGAYTLEGFHRISEVSQGDYDMLAVCQADFSQ